MLTLEHNKSPSQNKHHKITPRMRKLLQQYYTTREKTVEICQPLAPDDYIIQPSPTISPPKWHLAHTNLYFENYVVVPFHPKYQQFHSEYNYLFGSNFEAGGRKYPEFKRGLISRPSLEQIKNYRRYTDQYLEEVLTLYAEGIEDELEERITLGLNHEQQHQELLLTDIKYIYATSPLRPCYHTCPDEVKNIETAQSWYTCKGGVVEIGYDGEEFSFANESPLHRVYLEDFKLTNRLVTNEEYMAFIKSGAYEDPVYWSPDGWDAVQTNRWRAPLYWEKVDNQWVSTTLHGCLPIELCEPVCHVSYYEADAYAKWSGHRFTFRG